MPGPPRPSDFALGPDGFLTTNIGGCGSRLKAGMASVWPLPPRLEKAEARIREPRPYVFLRVSKLTLAKRNRRYAYSSVSPDFQSSHPRPPVTNDRSRRARGISSTSTNEQGQMETSPELLRLPADCSIGGIRIVYDLMCKALSRQTRLELDCSGVDKADVTSVQLLISTAKTAHHQGSRVRLTSVSDVLRSAIRRAGVSSRAMPESHSAQPAEIK